VKQKYRLDVMLFDALKKFLDYLQNLIFTEKVLS
jgi:hypothetical protein